MPKGITYKQTVEAINSLIAKDQSLTLDNIRAELKTGSKTTVMKHYNRWCREERPDVTPQTQKNLELPKNIILGINDAINARYSEVKIEYEKRLTSAEEDNLSLSSELEDFEEKNSQLEKIIRELETQLQAEQLHSKRLVNEIEQIKNKLDIKNKSSEDFKLQIARLEFEIENLSTLKKENKNLTSELNEVKFLAYKFEKEAAVANAKLDINKDLINSLNQNSKKD